MQADYLTLDTAIWTYYPFANRWPSSPTRVRLPCFPLRARVLASRPQVCPLNPSNPTKLTRTLPGLLSTPGSPLTPSPEENSPPPAKRRKLSPNVALATKPAGAEKLSPFGSPLSGGPEEDDDDDEPLALSFPKKSNGADLGFGSSGSSSTMSIDGIPATAPSTSPKPGPSPAKKGAGKTAAHTAPVDLPPPSDEALALMNGEIEMQPGPEHIVKVEDRMDEQQLDHLAAGVAIDSGGTHADVRNTFPNELASLTTVLSFLGSKTRKSGSSRASQGHHQGHRCGKRRSTSSCGDTYRVEDSVPKAVA